MHSLPSAGSDQFRPVQELKSCSDQTQCACLGICMHFAYFLPAMHNFACNLRVSLFSGSNLPCERLLLWCAGATEWHRWKRHLGRGRAGRVSRFLALDGAEEIRSQFQPCHDLCGFGQLAQSGFRHPSASQGSPCGTAAQGCVSWSPRGSCSLRTGARQGLRHRSQMSQGSMGLCWSISEVV